jgi:5-hydroxyisourate hydrolase
MAAPDGSAGRLTTHVLDTALGAPAQSLLFELFRLENGRRERLASLRTNAAGRCDGPLLSGSEFRPGVYELTFHVGDYFRAQGLGLAEPLFLDEVPIRFGINDASQHAHVPLLISPFGYTTYRGS